MSKIDLAIAACLIFIIGTGVFVFIQLNPLSLGTSGQTQGAKVKIQQQKRPSTLIVTSQPNESGENDDTLFTRLAAEPKARKIELKDVIGSNTSGIAYVLSENGKMFVTAVANMPGANPGYYYQAWLMKETPRRYYVPLGKLKPYGVGKFISNTSLDTNYPDFNTMIITLEKNEDKLPERFVMQGTMQ